MAYSYGLKNTYRPGALAPHAYGWTSGPGYTAADIPHALMDAPLDITHDQYVQQFAYEWFQSHESSKGFTNPPFLSGAAGRLMPMLRDAGGAGPARILRGYIRRAAFDTGDDRSKARLYFMFNPEIISRDYVSYLNQTALDPFNTVYGTANDVAPPSFMDFSFSIFFDRQEEATDPSHPGVFVDYQYFDLVVRNVTPTDANQTNNTLPDNGVMMVNPRDVTVVFSPQITVQGRPLNANVRFEKFTHRMTPTRMTITMTIRVIYIGPVKEMTEYTAETLQAEDQIFLYNEKRDLYKAPKSSDENDANNNNFNTDPSNMDASTQKYLEITYGIATDGSDLVRKAAIDWCYDIKNVNALTQYQTDGNKRANLPVSADCSGLIACAFNAVGVGDDIGWFPPAADVDHMYNTASNNDKKHFIKRSLNNEPSFDWKKDLRPGDVLYRHGHVAFFVGYLIGTNGDTTGMRTFGAESATASPQVGEHPIEGKGEYTDMIRVVNVGSLSSIAGSKAWSDNMIKSGNAPAADVLTRDETVVGLTGQGANILLAPSALPAWNAWRSAWGGPIPCTSGWRDPVVQQAAYEKDKANGGDRFAPAASSYHCKGKAVDVDYNWLTAMSASEQTRFRNAAKAAGWGQCRWRQKAGPMPGYECPCNPDKGTNVSEGWHFSTGGCG